MPHHGLGPRGGKALAKALRVCSVILFIVWSLKWRQQQQQRMTKAMMMTTMIIRDARTIVGLGGPIGTKTGPTTIGEQITPRYGRLLKHLFGSIRGYISHKHINDDLFQKNIAYLLKIFYLEITSLNVREDTSAPCSPKWCLLPSAPSPVSLVIKAQLGPFSEKQGQPLMFLVVPVTIEEAERIGCSLLIHLHKRLTVDQM